MGEVERVPVAAFGKDHWSMLAYCETRAVDRGAGRMMGKDEPSISADFWKTPVSEGIGEIDPARVRCNTLTHPLLRGVRPSNETDWKPEWGSRVKGGRVLADHDDWDVLDDLEAAGYLEVISTVNGVIRMTVEGMGVAARLRAHKAAGGQYAGFNV